ncbi:MAG: spermine synthase [Chthoniobacterales bacterium]
MKPFHTLAETTAPEGGRFTLHEHDGEYFMKLNGRQLMSSTSTSSEILLAKLACENLLRHPHPRILIGGLGLGFSLKAVLSLVGKKAEVHVAELLPEVIEWNRQFLMKLNGALLDDRRVQAFAEDVNRLIRRGPKGRYDAILLDVDNGPTSFVQEKNKRLYSRRGFERIAAALQPGGRVAFWSATEEEAFGEALARAGFRVHVVEAKSHERAKRFEHRIYIGETEPRHRTAPAAAAETPNPKLRSATKSQTSKLQGSDRA